MNKGNLLFDEKYLNDLFIKEILPLYPDFVSIEKIEVKPYKKLMWETTYHLVVKYLTHFINHEGEVVKVPIVATAHSSEERENVFLTLSYLWEHHLADREISLPRPLFYHSDLRATFYRAIEGRNLLYFIKDQAWPEIEDGVIKAARLFAKLHSLPLEGGYQFNLDNARVATVLPGVEFTLNELKSRFSGRYFDFIKSAYEVIIAKENNFLDNTSQRWLVHGDAHPENLIKLPSGKIGLIDFTDFCRADFARDLGAFSQQLEYKIITKAKYVAEAGKMKDLFISEYFKNSQLKLTPEIAERIALYYNFASLRTTVYWLLKHDCDPSRAEFLIDNIRRSLNLKV
ncbi:MAG: aminoglycoside phosphotransferase family protein [Patescibacteria group bacterium]